MTTSNLELSQQKLPNISKVINFLLLFIALFALSFTAIFIKISVSEISANATLFNRLWIATIIFGLWNGLKQVKSRFSASSTDKIPPVTDFKQGGFLQQGAFFLVIVAVLHLSGRFLWTWSLTQTTTANATVLSNITPLFTALGGWLFLGHYFDRRFLTGLSLSILGTITLGVSHLSFSNGGLIGDLAALSSALFYATNGLIIERLRDRFSSSTILIWRASLSTLFIIPGVLIFDKQIFPISPLGWFAVIALALICEAIGHGLVVYSLKNFTAGFVGVFLLLESIITAILAWIIFSEKVDLINCIAFIMIMLGIYLAKTGKGAEKN